MSASELWLWPRRRTGIRLGHLTCQVEFFFHDVLRNGTLAGKRVHKVVSFISAGAYVRVSCYKQVSLKSILTRPAH